MRVSFLISLILCLVRYSVAQSVISTQGDSYSNSNGSLDFTIGETVTSTESDGNTTLTQGFHQGNWNVTGVEDYIENIEATIYPNPSQNVLNIKSEVHENITYSLYDAKGNLIASNSLSEEITSIQVSWLAAGNYTVILEQDNSKIKKFNLIKIK